MLAYTGNGLWMLQAWSWQLLITVTLWTIYNNGASNNVTWASPNKGIWHNLHACHRFCFHHNLEALLLQGVREIEASRFHCDFHPFGRFDGGIEGGRSRTNIGDSSPENSYCCACVVLNTSLHGGIVDSIMAKPWKQRGAVHRRTN